MFDILVVGGNLIGATAALALSQAGHRVALLDQRPLVAKAYTGSQYDPRVIAVAPASQALWQRLGVWQAMRAQRAGLYDQMRVWEQQLIQFDAIESGDDALGYIVEQSVALSALYQAIEQSEISLLTADTVVHLELGDEQTPATVVTEQGERYQCRLVVAADGVNSPLRNMAMIDHSVYDYHQQGIVCTLHCPNGHQHTAWQRFTTSGPLALLPLGGNDDQYVSIVYSLDDADAAMVMAYDDQAFIAHLSEVSHHALGDIVSCSERFSFPLRQALASRYYRGNLVLVGDAAHGIHPLAGQGANLGLADVAALTHQLTLALNANLSASSHKALAAYSLARKPANKLTAYSMTAFYWLFGSDNPWLSAIRNDGLAVANRLPWLKRLIVGRASNSTL